jgi:hypothetical protein
VYDTRHNNYQPGNIPLYTGCHKGWWGSDCSIPSPGTCVDRHCYPSNGSCVWGCDHLKHMIYKANTYF